MAVLECNVDYIRRDLLQVQAVKLVKQEDATEEQQKVAETAVPGQPSYQLTPI